MSADAAAAATEPEAPPEPEGLAEWLADQPSAEVTATQKQYVEAWVSNAFSLPARFVLAGWRIAGVNGGREGRAFVMLAQEGV